MKHVIMACSALVVLTATPTLVRADALNNAAATVRQKVYEITGKDSATLSFPKGSSVLTSGDSAELKGVLNAVRADAHVKEILVVAYADHDYPRSQKDDLPKAAIDLAAKRGDAVKAKLDGMGASNVKVYNMAKKAGWFEKTFTTADSEIKREAAASPQHESNDDAFYEALGKRLKTDGGANKVVVVVRHDGSYAH